MLIVDDYLDIDYFNKLSALFNSNEFPWYYQNNITIKDDIGDGAFVHTFYRDDSSNSSFLPALHQLFNKLAIKKILRAKVNLYPRTDNIVIHQRHIDLPDFHNPYKTALLYINTNNGKTIFDDQSVDSVENRIAIFDQFMYHRSTTCTDKKIRMTLNVNYV
jgi:hypothetical protein